ncbi:MAG: uroporphyrinogen-III synthase [Nitriliruptorales bacterium]|nr:uroporphyrinogen-III synthase [Nitriliruptorales bacterium]
MADAAADRPLRGLRIGVTGARKSAELARALERKGAQAVLGPTTAGDLPADPQLVLEQTRAILAAEPTWVACTTGMGVRSWLAAAHAEPALEMAIEALLARTRVVARGAKAEGALRAIGVRPEFIPPRELDADVVAWLTEHVAPGDVVAACLHSQPEDIFDPVRAAGATVLTVSPYRSALPDNPAPAVELLQQLLEGRLQIVAFTSPGAVRGFVDIATQHELIDQVREAGASAAALAAVGVATASEVERHGLPVSIMPARPRTGALIKEIVWWARPDGGRRSPTVVQLDPRQLTAAIQEDVVELPPIEYEVLATLARRPLRAVSTDVIATEVWGDPSHAARVPDAVSRLRDRLAGSVSIEAVRGAGYTLQP